MNGGWIYIFMTSSDYNRFKVGRTKNNPMIRLKNLKTGDPNLGLLVAYFVPEYLSLLPILEKEIHKQLGESLMFHNESFSEWFSGEASESWRKLEIIFSCIGLEVINYPTLDVTKVTRFWEADVICFYATLPKICKNELPW